MTRKFASIELARLYETQGHFQEALNMYNELDDNVLTGGAEVRAAKKRLELAILNMDFPDDIPSAKPEAFIAQTLEELNGNDPESEPAPVDEHIADMMKRWVRLILAQKRLALFKKMAARP